jgi:hypothetical protein
MFGDVHTMPIFVLSKYTNDMKHYAMITDEKNFTYAIAVVSETNTTITECGFTKVLDRHSAREKEWFDGIKAKGHKFTDIDSKEYQYMKNEIVLDVRLSRKLGKILFKG